MASRTTTTIIRTTQGSSGGHKRKRSRPTSKPKSRPKARTSSARRSSLRKSSSTKRFTTTSAERQAYKDRANKTSYVPLLGLLGLLGLGGAIFFISKSASASQGPGGQPGQPGEPGKVGPLFPPNPAPPPGPNGGGTSPGGTSPGGHVHPPPGTPATVAVTVGVPAGSQPGLKLRPGPAPGGATVGADLPNGAAITVVQSNVPQQGDTAPNSPLRWWQVRTADGRTGYVRVIGPENIWNVQFAGRQPATGRVVQATSLPSLPLGPMLNGYRPAPRPFAAVAHDPFQALVARQHLPGWR